MIYQPCRGLHVETIVIVDRLSFHLHFRKTPVRRMLKKSWKKNCLQLFHISTTARPFDRTGNHTSTAAQKYGVHSKTGAFTGKGIAFLLKNVHEEVHNIISEVSLSDETSSIVNGQLNPVSSC